MTMASARLIVGVLLGAGTVLSLTSCGDGSNGNMRRYDIGAIVSASPDKCEQYNGEREMWDDDSPLLLHCWVSLDDCKRAAGDWNEIARKIQVPLFRCQ